MSELPTPSIQPNLDTQAFWAATKEGRLRLPRCDRCGLVIWYPRPICPDCHSSSLTEVDCAGTGEVYSFTIVRKAGGAWAEHTPFVVAFVEIDEGPRIATNIVDVDPETVAIGTRVEVAFDDAGDLGAVPRFRPLSTRITAES